MTDQTRRPGDLRLGDFVSTPFDNGLKGTTLYGLVVRPSGALVVTVFWESGLTNRIRIADRDGNPWNLGFGCVKRIPESEVDASGLRNLKRELAERE